MALNGVSGVVPTRQPPAHAQAPASQCPYCDQPIPDEHADEIRHRIEARERDQAEKAVSEAKTEHDRVLADTATVQQHAEALKQQLAPLDEQLAGVRSHDGAARAQ